MFLHLSLLLSFHLQIQEQNSLVYENWKIYRWAYSQLKNQSEKVKDEILTFIGDFPTFKMMEDYLPKQRGKIIELKDHQQEAVENLQEMRKNGDSIALLYHATGERVIIVTGCINALATRVSETFKQN